MQPLNVILIVALRHLLSFLTCEQICCLLSAISCFVFLIGSVEFARHITHQSRAKILIAAMFLPEMYAIAMYPNTAIPAAACFIWALNGIIRNRHWTAIVLMCVAALFRVDVVIVYPVILPLLIFQGNTWKKALAISSIYCIIIVAVGLLLFCLCKADVLSAFSGYEEWNDTIGIKLVLLAIFGFYSLAYLLLLPIGIVRMGKEKLWKELLLVLLPIVLLHFIYRSMGCAAKHYLYIAPFVIIVGIRALIWICDIVQRKVWLKWLTFLVVISYFTAFVRITMLNRPWSNKNGAYTETIIKSVFSTDISTYRLSAGIGAGQFVPTQDERMLASGQLFYSWYIHAFKKEILSPRKKTKKIMDSLPTSDIIFIEWGLRGTILSEYMKENNIVRYNHGNESFTVSNAARHLTVRLDENYNEDEDSFWRQTKKYCLSLHRDSVYIITTIPQAQLYFDSISKRTSVEKKTEMLYKVNIDNLK